MTTNSQLSTTESKKQTKQTMRTGTESQIWRSFGGLSAGRGYGENGRKGRDYEVQVGRYKIERWDVKNSTENGVAKKLICMTHGHELGVIVGGNADTRWRGTKREILGQL